MIDDESEPGAWAREIAARRLRVHELPAPRSLHHAYTCAECGWAGEEASITDASSEVERNGRVEIDRTHLAVCPKCFTVIREEKR